MSTRSGGTASAPRRAPPPARPCCPATWTTTGRAQAHLPGSATSVFVRPGSRYERPDESGVSREFTVLAREQWNKGEVPLDRLFDRSGAPRLVLITCGGSFNSSTLGYDDNIAITAVPISQ